MKISKYQQQQFNRFLKLGFDDFATVEEFVKYKQRLTKEIRFEKQLARDERLNAFVSTQAWENIPKWVRQLKMSSIKNIEKNPQLRHRKWVLKAQLLEFEHRRGRRTYKEYAKWRTGEQKKRVLDNVRDIYEFVPAQRDELLRVMKQYTPEQLNNFFKVHSDIKAIIEYPDKFDQYGERDTGIGYAQAKLVKTHPYEKYYEPSLARAASADVLLSRLKAFRKNYPDLFKTKTKKKKRKSRKGKKRK